MNILMHLTKHGVVYSLLFLLILPHNLGCVQTGFQCPSRTILPVNVMNKVLHKVAPSVVADWGAVSVVGQSMSRDLSNFILIPNIARSELAYGSISVAGYGPYGSDFSGRSRASNAWISIPRSRTWASCSHISFPSVLVVA